LPATRQTTEEAHLIGGARAMGIMQGSRCAEGHRRLTRFVLDCGAVLHLAAEGEIDVADEHELLAPTLLRSQTLSALHEAVHRGEIGADEARLRLQRIGRKKIRLLGDAVLRRRAWEIADQLGWADTYDAEYVALTLLQGDAFVTMDAELARSVQGVVTTASIDALR
jgi:predicted nucleic acid-binding protein